MKLISIGLLLWAAVCPALGLETQYLPPAHPEYTLQSLEYQAQDDSILPAHSLDEDGYHYRVGNSLRYKREALQPATYDDLYAQSRNIAQGLPQSEFVGPSPDQIAVPSYSSAAEDNFVGPPPDQVAHSSGEQQITYNQYQNQYQTQYQNQNQYQNQYQNTGDIYGAPTAYQPVQQELGEPTLFAGDGYHYRIVRQASVR